MQEGNEGLVHHLLVYECHGKFNDSLYGPGFDCGNTANIPFRQCFYSSIVAVWAVGGEVRAVGLALKLSILISTENDQRLVTFFSLSILFSFFIPVIAFFFSHCFFLFLYFFFLFHLTLCHYPDILLPAKSWLSNWI